MQLGTISTRGPRGISLQIAGYENMLSWYPIFRKSPSWPWPWHIDKQMHWTRLNGWWENTILYNQSDIAFVDVSGMNLIWCCTQRLLSYNCTDNYIVHCFREKRYCMLTWLCSYLMCLQNCTVYDGDCTQCNFPVRLHRGVSLSWDVIKWNDFPRYWPFGWKIHRSPVNSPHKGLWCGALIFLWYMPE